jgi:hypothetical protein
MTTRIEDMGAQYQIPAWTLKHALEAANEPHVITSTRRSDSEQIALHAQGRKKLEEVNALRGKAHMGPITDNENSYTVTNCDGVTTKSPHQAGRAIDIVPLVPHIDVSGRTTMRPTWNYIKYAEEYKRIGAIARGLGWVCGQDWPPVDPVTGLGRDPPHMERKV